MGENTPFIEYRELAHAVLQCYSRVFTIFLASCKPLPFRISFELKCLPDTCHEHFDRASDPGLLLPSNLEEPDKCYSMALCRFDKINKPVPTRRKWTISYLERENTLDIEDIRQNGRDFVGWANISTFYDIRITSAKKSQLGPCLGAGCSWWTKSGQVASWQIFP